MPTFSTSSAWRTWPSMSTARKTCSGGRQLGGHFGAEAEHREALVEHERAVDGGEIGQHPAVLEHRLLELLEVRALVGREIQPAYRIFGGGGGDGFQDLK